MWSNITADKLSAEMERSPGRILLVDVRDKADYELEHIKGAISIPLTELSMRAEKCFAKDREIILYCTNTACRASVKASRILDSKGYTNVVDFEGGLADWKQAGLPTEGTVKRRAKAA